MNRIVIALGLLLAGLLTACEAPVDSYQVSQKFEHKAWYYADSLKLRIPVEDTTRSYQLKLRMQLDESYPYRNLYVKFKLQPPKGKPTESQLDFVLADAAGKWNVEKGMGGLYTFDEVLMKNLRLPQPGEYTLGIKQYMRVDTLPGVRSIQLDVVPNTEQTP